MAPKSTRATAPRYNVAIYDRDQYGQITFQRPAREPARAYTSYPTRISRRPVNLASLRERYATSQESIASFSSDWTVRPSTASNYLRSRRTSSNYTAQRSRHDSEAHRLAECYRRQHQRQRQQQQQQQRVRFAASTETPRTQPLLYLVEPTGKSDRLRYEYTPHPQVKAAAWERCIDTRAGSAAFTMKRLERFTGSPEEQPGRMRKLIKTVKKFLAHERHGKSHEGMVHPSQQSGECGPGLLRQPGHGRSQRRDSGYAEVPRDPPVGHNVRVDDVVRMVMGRLENLRLAM